MDGLAPACGFRQQGRNQRPLLVGQVRWVGLSCVHVVDPTRLSSDLTNTLSEIIKKLLQEHQRVLTHDAAEVMRTLSPLARSLIAQNKQTASLSLPYAIFEPRGADEVMVALPLWQGLSDLLLHRLIEFSRDERKGEEGYFWTKKARRLFSTG